MQCGHDVHHGSPDYLSRLFGRETGGKLSEFIGVERLALARRLLLTTSMNVAQVSRASGYADPSYFARLFKQGTGVSPRGFRAAMASRQDGPDR